MKVALTSSLRNPTKTKFDATTFLQNTVPSFLQETKYKQLVFFLQNYLEWLATKGNPLYVIQNIENFIDVDNTPEEFLNILFEKYFNDVPLNIVADKRLLLKHARDLYTSKGTESAYKLLFQILYNEEIDITYPGQFLFETSNSNWTEKNYIKVAVNDTFLISPEIIGQKITGRNSHAVATIENVSSYYLGDQLIGNYSIYNITGKFFLDEEIVIKVGNTEYQNNSVIPSPAVDEIIEAGNNFNIGYSFIVGNNNDSFSLRIAQVKNDKIHSISVKNGGENYVVGEIVNAYQGEIRSNNFSGFVSEVDENGSILSVKITRPAMGFTQTPSLKILTKSGTRAELEAISPKCGAISSLDFMTAPNQFQNDISQTIQNPKIGGVGEDAIVKIGKAAVVTVKTYPTIFNSFTSNSAIKLQDSKVNQRLSYIIKSGINFNEFVGIVKKLLHPSGYNIAGKYFAAIQISAGLFGGQIELINNTKYKFAYVNHYINLPLNVIATMPAQIISRFWATVEYDSGFRNGDMERYKDFMDDTPVLPFFGDMRIMDLYKDNSNPLAMDIVPMILPFQITYR